MKNLKKAEDDQLVKCYMNGQELAFEILIKRHKKEIYQKIYLLVRDKLAAEDILQDTFIKILKSINSGAYNEEGKFLPWALTVARNLCLDYKRKAKRPKHFHYNVALPENLIRESSSIKCKISERQLQQQIESILNQLPEAQRTVIKYRHFEDMSFKEISVAMGTSVNTTIGRMRYGIQSLNRMIGNNRSVFQ